jgi:dipeptidase E
MRMLLTSGGISTDLMKSTVLDLLGKPFEESTLVVIIDAMLPFGGDRTKMLEHLEGLRALGWKELNIMSLFGGPRSVIEQRLRDADVILGYGGTNHWLAHAWKATGLAPLFRELLDEKIYVGWSAGSMIFTRLYDDVVKIFNDEGEVDWLELDDPGPALPLFDWALIPHLGADFFPEQTDEWAIESAARFAAPVYYLDDNSALLIRDPDAAPEVVSSGHWLQFDDGRLTASDTALADPLR